MPDPTEPAAPEAQVIDADFDADEQTAPSGDASPEEPKAEKPRSEERSRRKAPRTAFDDFRLEIDPEKIDEAVRSLSDRVRRLVDQGRYTRVRIKYKGRPLMPDIPLGVFVATEAVTFWYAGILRSLVVNLGVRTFVEVEFVHEADQKVREGIELYMDGEVEAAEARYREALRMRADDTAALYNLGVLLRVTGRRKEAVECLEKAAAATSHPDAERARQALESMKRGARGE